MKRIFVVVTLIVLGIYAYADINENAGKSALSWLKIGVGARPGGMGDVYTAIGNDATSIFWNPACLAQVDKRSLMFMHSIWFSDITYDALALVLPTFDEFWLTTRAIGIGITAIDMGWVQETPEAGWVLGDPTSRFRPNGNQFIFAFSQRVGEALAFGVNIKMVSEQLYNTTNTSYTGDLGFLYRGGNGTSNISMGGSVQNVGGFMYGNTPLPQIIRGGIGFDAAESVVLGADVCMPSDHGMITSIGSEFRIGSLFTFRAGYSMNADDDKLGTSSVTGLPSGITLGFGINTDTAGIDIALIPFGSLGDTVKASAIFKF